MCWWRDDLSRRLDNAWDLKWIYSELMTGPDLIRAVMEQGLSEKREKRATKWFSKSADKEDPFGTH